jgi:hypothetical protein
MARMANPGRAGWAETIRHHPRPSRPPGVADDAGRGFTMKVIARIPLMPPAAEVQPFVAAIGEPTAGATPAPQARAAPDPRRRGARPHFPAASITALALLAAAAWSLATWNDARRAERSRLERLARMHAPAATEETLSR